MTDIIKTPAETYPVTIDYTDKLPSGSSVASGAVSVIDFADDSDVSATIKPGSVTATSTALNFDLVAGTAGKDYLVIVTATITGSKPIVNYWRLRVKAPSL